MMDKIFKVYKAHNLRNRQRRVNKRFEEEGFSDEILAEQIEINTERNKHDIIDETETDGDYVQ